MSVENALYHYAFTWNKPKDESDDDFSKSGPKRLIDTLAGMSRFVFQLERGLNAGVLHFQGYLGLKKKQRLSTLATILHKAGLHGLHLSAAVDTEALKKYCLKKDPTYVAGPWDDRDSGQDIPVLDEKALYPWQAEILRQLRENPDDRKVCWLVDSKGAAGKSSFAKFLCKHKIALPMTYTDAKDCMYMVTQQSHQPAYVFDLTRCKPAALSATDLYSVMEQLKNGLLQNTKYVAKAGILRPPTHVWVFSNSVPDYKSLSQDRWMVYEINENRNLIGFDKDGFIAASKKKRIVDAILAGREAKRRKIDQEAIDDAIDDLSLDPHAVANRIIVADAVSVNPNAEV